MLLGIYLRKNEIILASWCKELTHWRRPWGWESLRAGGEGDNRGWDGWMASLTRWKWVWVDSGVGDGQEGLVCCGSRDRKESDTTERLNWTEPCELSILLSPFYREIKSGYCVIIGRFNIWNKGVMGIDLYFIRMPLDPIIIREK